MKLTRSAKILFRHAMRADFPKKIQLLITALVSGFLFLNLGEVGGFFVATAPLNGQKRIFALLVNGMGEDDERSYIGGA